MDWGNASFNHTIHSDAADKIHQHMQGFFNQGADEIVALLSLLIILFVAFCLFVVFLLLHGHQSQHIYHHLAANCTLAHIPTALFYHAGSIHMILMAKSMSLSYCKFWLWIGYFTQIITPYTLLMFSIERLMYIRNPTGHAQKINCVGHITLVAFPWLTAIVIASIVSIFLKGNYYVQDLESSHSSVFIFGCYAYSGSIMIIDFGVRTIFGGILPLLLCLVITITVLIMWCCFKKNHALGRDYAMMGEQVEITVRNSVIAVSVLNFLYIATFITEASVHYEIGYGLFSVFGVIECIIWLTTIVNVRNKFVSLFACCQRNAPAEASAGGHTVEEPSNT